MAQAKAVDIRSMSGDQLKKRLDELQKQRFNMRFQQSSGQMENTAQSRLSRREIALVKTIMSERKLGINTDVAAKPAPKKTKAKAKSKSSKEKTSSTKKAAPATKKKKA